MAGLSSFLLLGNVGNAAAAVNPPNAPTSSAVISPQSASFTWSASTPGGTENVWVVRHSLGGTATPVTDAILSPTSTVLTYTFTGLATNTAYTFGVAGSDGVASSTEVTSSLRYTAAAVPNTPTLSTSGAQNLLITFATDTNPAANTTFIVKDTNASVGLKYLQANGTWGVATATLSWSQLGGGSATTTTGLATNTQHTISVAAVNGDSSATSTYSTTVNGYTGTATPNLPTLSSTAPGNLLITMATDTNPAANTTFLVRDNNASVGLKYLQANGTWGASAVYLSWPNLGGGSATTTTGLATNTQHTISVAAMNGDSTSLSAFGASASLYTNPVTPNVPTLSVTTSTLSVTVDIATNPTSTTNFVVRDTASSTQTQYLQTNGTWGIATATLTWAQTGSGAALSTTGLTANTNHIISVAAVNGDSTVTSTYGATTSAYTLTSVPSVFAASTVTQNSLVLTWTGDGTAYYVTNLTDNSNSGWIAASSWTNSSLACGARYNYTVKARNGNNVETSNANLNNIVTTGCAGSAGVVSGGSGWGGGSTVVVPVKSNAAPTQVTLPAASVSPAVALMANQPKFSVTMKLGSRTASVKQLQTLLKGLGFFTYPTASGYFGPATRDAVVRFQKAKGIKPASGLVGPLTRAVLNSL